MVDALSNAANGLLSAQRRATDLATKILEGVSAQPQFSDEKASSENAAPPSSEEVAPKPESTGSSPAFDAGQASLVQQLVDFKAAELQFKASASAFKSIADAQEQALGQLFDDEG